MDHVSHCGTFGNAPFLDSDMFAHFLKKKLWAPSKAPFSTVHRAVVRYMREITLGDKGSTGILASHDKKLGNLIKQYHDSFTSLTTETSSLRLCDLPL